MKYRTDLAIERVEAATSEMPDKDALDGVEITKKEYSKDVVSTRITILDEKGAKILEKPLGNYITIEAKGVLEERDGIKEAAEKALYTELSNMIKFHYNLKVLIVGLGNMGVTPDALGPITAGKIKVTRHLFIIFNADGDEKLACVSCIVPGVSATTGMETADIIAKAVEITKPEIVITIDSLAAKSIDRVSTTIQISDTGISPGGGMGTVRKAINEETVGARVLAIGVPTVIDATTIIRDALTSAGGLRDSSLCGSHREGMKEVEEYIDKFDEELIVTSTDIDAIIKDFSDIIANGINKTLHPGIYS